MKLGIDFPHRSWYSISSGCGSDANGLINSKVLTRDAIAESEQKTIVFLWVGMSCLAQSLSRRIDLVTDSQERDGLFVPTSKLQRYTSSMLSVHFGEYTIRENIRPAWLAMPDGTRLELDFYVEELTIGIEVQGAQHYIYTPHFHKKRGDFQARLERDQFKRDCCIRRGVTLVEIASEQDVRDFILSFQKSDDVDLIKVYAENTERIQELYREYIEKRSLRKLLIKTFNKNRARGVDAGTHKHLMRTTERLKKIKHVLRIVVGEDALK